MQTYDVIIAGYGPVAQVAGNILGRAGVRTLIIDRLKSIFDIPRAIHFDDEIMRVFQALGLEEEIRPRTVTRDAYRFVNSRGQLLFEKKFGGTRTINGHAGSYFFFQPEIEACLRAGMERFASVTLCLGHEVLAYHADESGVQVDIRDLDHDTTRRIAGRYLLGCDGGRSLVRKTMGYGLHDYKHDQPWLVVDCNETGATRFPDNPHQLCDPERTCTLIPSRERHRRWEIYLKPGDDPEAMNRPEKIHELIAPWAEPGRIEIIRSAVYRFHALIARRWRDGRVLIAGDAAHQMPPFLGQGMCSGIRDAYNLAWKLRLVLRTGASPDLLDTYQQERFPHVKFMTDKAILAGRIIQARGLAALIRDFLFYLLGRVPGGREAFVKKTSTWPRFKSGFFLRGPGSTSRAPEGELFPQPYVFSADTDAAELLDHFLGEGFAVLARSSDALHDARELDPDLWERLDTRFVLIADEANQAKDRDGSHFYTVVQDRDGSLGHWFAAHRARIVILRPDRHIFGINPNRARIARVRRYLYPENKTTTKEE